MTPENRKKLAELIEFRKNEILEAWRGRIRPILQERNLETPALNNEMPDFLTELARKIRDVDTPHSWNEQVNNEEKVSRTATSHGKQRFEVGYDIVEVLKEYGILREVIIDLAEGESLVIGGKGGHVLNFTFNKAAAVAAEVFQREKEIEAQRRRKEYLAFVMHDLKTPLNAIMIAAQVIEGNPDNAKLVDEMIHIILRSGGQLDEFIQQTIKNEKADVSEGAEDLVPRNFELWPLVQSVIEEQKLIAEDSHTSILNLVPANLTAYADAVAMKTVFRNLISNAIKYAPGGKIVIGVTTSRHDAIECWVRDTGAGIPPDRLKTIFEKGTHDPNKKGSTGLGLAMVKKIVEAHGGNVTAESKVGEGTTFRVVLPMKKALTSNVALDGQEERINRSVAVP
ncbi:MAG TPA: sensor histidine kinase [Candidatus Kapabacteria bacterium]|nr:sensor histidine kinase [Candidatus Kapabacteria bacterium]